MRKPFADVVRHFVRDERGASLLEYTILLAIISVAALTAVINVGGWVGQKWTALYTTVQPH
jgi:pilus assembly protein Flp/PilA